MTPFKQQMFKSMRNTIPDGGIIDGGYGEEVFTEMFDEEISKAGASQDLFKDLNRSIYNQLNETRGDMSR
ncbi:MAG: rod-binding protein [Bacillota bacterium]